MLEQLRRVKEDAVKMIASAQRTRPMMPTSSGTRGGASWTPPEANDFRAGRPLATPTKNDQLLLEHEILCDHRSHATGPTQLRGHDGEVQQGEQEVLHARVSVGQTPGGTQRCPIRESARELAIRDLQRRPSGKTFRTRGRWGVARRWARDRRKQLTTNNRVCRREWGAQPSVEFRVFVRDLSQAYEYKCFIINNL